MPRLTPHNPFYTPEAVQDDPSDFLMAPHLRAIDEAERLLRESNIVVLPTASRNPRTLN